MEEEIQKALQTLQAGQLLLYPTDTVWGIGCDATNPEAVNKVYGLKRRAESKALICLVSDFEMLKTYIPEIPEQVFDVLKTQNKPTTIIYNHPIGLAKNLISSDDTVAIRIGNTPFCQGLIKAFGKPIVSTSANISGEPTAKSFAQISAEIVKGVDYVVNLQRETVNTKPSTIIKIEADGSLTLIRE